MTSYTVTARIPESSSQFARVEVEPVEVTDRYGKRVVVTGFWLNGPAWPQTEGHKIRLDGQRYATRALNLDVPVPAEILDILHSLIGLEA